MSKWICETCVYYPPSSGDGKPCSCCNPDDPLMNCYSEREMEDIYKEIIKYLLDWIEDEHMGARAEAVKCIKEKFDIEL